MFRWHPDKFEQKFGRSGAPVKWIKHQKFTGQTAVFCWLPTVDFMRNSMSFLCFKTLHDFDDSVDGLAQPWGSCPRRNRTRNLPLLLFSNSSSNVEVWLGKRRLGGPFALSYRWKMMWTLTIAGFLAWILSINSIFFISSWFVNIQNSDVFTYRFWAVKARSVFLS